MYLLHKLVDRSKIYANMIIVRKQKEDIIMMKFERTLEDGQYEIWRSTNHADPKRFAEITLGWDNEDGNLMVCLLYTSPSPRD